MSLFRILWLRRLIRKHTAPMPYRKADRWRTRMAVLYGFLCWNIFGYTIYLYANGRLSKEAYGIEKDIWDDLSPSQAFAIRTGIQKAKIVRNGEVIDFNLADYKEYVDLMNAPKEKDIGSTNDEDNVA